ncbi:AraC family transcriptional regulator [Dyadobacter beijingensis]|uniref:AraC family transcriptional regulator n=1 Tax=Dyadobacter beijingensis TaxID=365489 RepID=A0ABQ2I914_9BACT|nr:helix-turn-helix transcriptional regulator [Dyadobacter beijingensis]GGN02957.1 AraC family transcriptional regulator [Dyadobacter beijingensis]
MQINPAFPLSGIVRHFLVIESDRHAMMRIFSDGNTGIVFNYGDALSYQYETGPGTALLPAGFLYGQLDTFRNVRANGRIRLLIAVLYPFGAAALCQMPASELRNRIIGCDELFRYNAGSITDEIANSVTIFDKIHAAERFLLSQMQGSGSADALIANAISLIHKEHGLMPVARLARLSGVTERQLQRKFEAHIGISPKRYAGIARMQYALKMLRRKPAGLSLAGVACESGFFDQAHLIREMKNLSGLTPGQYLGPHDLLAANLIQISR